VHAVPCSPATVYAVRLWLYLLSAVGKLNTYIHTYYIYGNKKQSLWAIVLRCFPDPILAISVQYRLVADRRTDRQTYSAPAQRPAVKKN